MAVAFITAISVALEELQGGLLFSARGRLLRPGSRAPPASVGAEKSIERLDGGRRRVFVATGFGCGVCLVFALEKMLLSDSLDAA